MEAPSAMSSASLESPLTNPPPLVVATVEQFRARRVSMQQERQTATLSERKRPRDPCPTAVVVPAESLLRQCEDLLMLYGAVVHALKCTAQDDDGDDDCGEEGDAATAERNRQITEALDNMEDCAGQLMTGIRSHASNCVKRAHRDRLQRDVLELKRVSDKIGLCVQKASELTSSLDT